jgi:hypothetical protein
MPSRYRYACCECSKDEKVSTDVDSGSCNCKDSLSEVIDALRYKLECLSDLSSDLLERVSDIQVDLDKLNDDVVDAADLLDNLEGKVEDC